MRALAMGAWRLGWALGVGVLLAGCASQPAQQGASAGSSAATSPWLALAPSALGCTVAVQQRLTVQAPGQSAKELDALLEIDVTSMKLAILNLGQMVGTLEWDGEQIKPQLSRWWPAVLEPQQVLSDVQLAFWPQQAIAAALPEGWSLQVSAEGRVLQYLGAERVRLRTLGANALELAYLQGQWSLRIDSPAGADLCSNGTATR